MGNNFTWPNWLRFIIYDLGNNPRRMEKRGNRRKGKESREKERGEEERVKSIRERKKKRGTVGMDLSFDPGFI